MYRERGSKLTQDDLDYIRPYLEAINPEGEELAFIAESERAFHRKRNRLRATVVGIIAVLAAASVISIVARHTAPGAGAARHFRQLVARTTNALDDGILDLAALLAVEAASASPAVEARSPLLTWHLTTTPLLGYLHATAARSTASPSAPTA